MLTIIIIIGNVWNFLKNAIKHWYILQNYMKINLILQRYYGFASSVKHHNL